MALTGCDKLLEVEDPQAIQADQLRDPFYLNLATNGVVSDFQRMFDDVVLFGGVFTDELRNHATFGEEPLIDQRNVTSSNGTTGNLVYGQMQRARALADSTAGLFRALRGDSANSDLRYARVLAYAGLNYVLMGETLCEAPVNLSAPHTPEQLIRNFAIPRFEEAIQVATAARAVAAAATTPNSRTIAGADSIINLSRVGIARGSLNLFGFARNEADRQRAITFASAVPDNFLFFAYYSESATELNNFVHSRLTSTTQASVNNTPFFDLRGVDPRVGIPATHKVVISGVQTFVPNSPSSYSTYAGTLPGTPIGQGSNIRIASGLEARYIRAEAEGPTAANIAFIESRRLIAPGTAGTAAATQPTTAANFYANLRDQRRRDFYLDGHRLGDLRRYRTQYTNLESISQFQQGLYPGSTTVSYADNYCFPVNAAELAANPFYRNR
jgi:hypothetical protein